MGFDCSFACAHIQFCSKNTAASVVFLLVCYFLFVACFLLLPACFIGLLLSIYPLLLSLYPLLLSIYRLYPVYNLVYLQLGAFHQLLLLALDCHSLLLVINHRTIANCVY